MLSPAVRERLGRAWESRWTLPAILALAAALRLAYVLGLRSLPLFDRLLLDAEFYDAWAQRLAAGDWLDGSRPFFFDPLYPYVLAALYRAFGRDLLLVRLVHVALGTATCALAARLGRRVGGAAVGNLAALLLAVYGPAIFEEGEVEKTALGVFLVTAALALGLARSTLARGGAGLALGLAALARGNMILLAPAGALWFLLEPGPDRPDLRARARSALAFSAGVALALAPVTWRNHHVSGEWVLTTAGGGPNLYLGNNPWNESGGYQYLPWIRPQSAHEASDWRAETERRLGRSVTANEVSSYWLEETVRYVAASPGAWARVTARKVGRLLASRELADGWDLEFVSRFVPVLRLPLLGFAALLPFAALGMAAGRGRREVRFLAGYAALYLGSILLFWVFGRFRLYAVPALAVLAALGLGRLLRAARERDVRHLGFAAAGAAAVALVSLSAPAWADLPPSAPDQNFANLGGVWFERGDPGRAMAVLVSGLEEAPGSPAILCKIGELRIRMNDPRAALRDLYGCVRARETQPDAWYWIGIAHQRLGDPASAALAFRRQLAIVPGHEYAAAELARMIPR
jgi:4-amino-4-deoxy-L-arabinose transferase-like glycosyltransferase